MEAAECISCGAEITFREDPKMGDLVKCRKCDAELEVVWLDPIELDWPFEDDYYYEDED